ncbi:MAG: hypothetical protein HC794_01685 [Nitrospiraceae bacterium]|nr:hypothetical protein [Nitrospiraceae bacterium]
MAIGEAEALDLGLTSGPVDDAEVVGVDCKHQPLMPGEVGGAGQDGFNGRVAGFLQNRRAGHDNLQPGVGQVHRRQPAPHRAGVGGLLDGFDPEGLVVSADCVIVVKNTRSGGADDQGPDSQTKMG